MRICTPKISSEKYVTPRFSFLEIQNLKYGFGLSDMFIINDDGATFIMHTVLCLLKTFDSRNNRKPMGLECFV